MAKKSKEPENTGTGELVSESIAIVDLSPDPANLRKHSDRNLDAIRASLRKFGQVRPIVVDDRGIILAGNGTYEAARSLGWDRISIVRSGLKGSDATAYAIADNRTAELAEWHEKELAETLRSLQSEDFDLAAAGFDESEIDKLCGELADEMIADGDFPEHGEPESHTITLRYGPADERVLLTFLGESDRAILVENKAGAKILDRIREVAPG